MEDFGYILKEARKKKGLSQKELGKRLKIPQSHLSKIENGLVDLQTSNLIELSRALDLEMMLVPRELVVSFKYQIKNIGKDTKKQIPLYRLDDKEDNDH